MPGITPSSLQKIPPQSSRQSDEVVIMTTPPPPIFSDGETEAQEGKGSSPSLHRAEALFCV